MLTTKTVKNIKAKNYFSVKYEQGVAKYAGKYMRFVLKIERGCLSRLRAMDESYVELMLSPLYELGDMMRKKCGKENLLTNF